MHDEDDATPVQLGAPDEAPPDIVELARSRASARAARHFAEADALRGRIEGAGWKPVDHGLDWTLERLHPPDTRVGGVTIHGASAGVPDRSDAPDVPGVSLLLVAPSGDAVEVLADWPRSAPVVQRVVVITAPPAAQGGTRLDGEVAAAHRSIVEAGAEDVWLAGPASPGAALAAGLRQCLGSVVVMLGPGMRPGAEIHASGDPAWLVGPLLDALADPSVAIAGAFGLRTSDLRHFAGPAFGDVEALDGACLAFRRADAREAGRLDEGYAGLLHLAIWWSLALRAREEGLPARRALALDLPLRTLAVHNADRATEAAERRDRYRLIRAFGTRRDLLLP